MCPDEPRPTGLVGCPRHEERRAFICQDEWRAWLHRGLACGSGRRLEARYCLVFKYMVYVPMLYIQIDYPNRFYLFFGYPIQDSLPD